MDYNLLLEINIFFTIIYGGLIAGFIYDIYKSIRYFSKRKIIKYLIDILFWVFLSFLFFIIIVRSNFGELRGYLVLGFILGIFIYIKVFSKFILPFIMNVFRVFINYSGKIVHILFYPFRCIIKAKNLIKKFFTEIKKDSKKYKKIISTKK